MDAKELVEKPLKGFTVKEMTEVYHTNEDGRKTKTIGFFRDEKIAKGFTQNQPSPEYFKTSKEYVLTDGNVGFIIVGNITLMDDEKAALEIREKALKKLSAEERGILGV
jgi:hypothetical protein